MRTNPTRSIFFGKPWPTQKAWDLLRNQAGLVREAPKGAPPIEGPCLTTLNPNVLGYEKRQRWR